MARDSSRRRRVVAALIAGSVPVAGYALLQALGIGVHVIGGADVAAELDAKRAIEQGTRLALKI